MNPYLVGIGYFLLEIGLIVCCLLAFRVWGYRKGYAAGQRDGYVQGRADEENWWIVAGGHRAPIWKGE